MKLRREQCQHRLYLLGGFDGGGARVNYPGLGFEAAGLEPAPEFITINWALELRCV